MKRSPWPIRQVVNLIACCYVPILILKVTIAIASTVREGAKQDD